MTCMQPFLMAVMLILAPLLSILPMYWIRKRLRLSIKVPPGSFAATWPKHS